MKQVQLDVWETAVESPFPGLTTHAYLLIREGGNVLFYNTSLPDEIGSMAELGGVQYHFLSHRDELGESIRVIRKRFDAKLGIHRTEQPDAERFCHPDLVFDRRELILEDIEVIPTPGHTPGSTCLLVHSPYGKDYLFTGDTLYLSNHVWMPGMLSFSHREDLIYSLNLLQTLRPDVVFSSAFSGDEGFQQVTNVWHSIVMQATERLIKQV